jgi:hypothetical protein
MDFLTKEERENLIIEYKHMHDDNWQRGHGIWLVNYILVTGSLIVAFQSVAEKSLAYVVALVLVIVAFTIQVTAGRVTDITYKRMEEIRKKLGMTETTEMYESEIHGKWWYFLRTKVAYALFFFLMVVYILLLFNNLGLLEITFSTVT